MMELRVIRGYTAPLRAAMAAHYSCPRGFVARRIVYRVEHEGISYGYTVGGSATLHLPGRDDFLGQPAKPILNSIVNNTFFHIERVSGKYPMRNFLKEVVLAWEAEIARDWEEKYGDRVVAFETLVELPRTGECYRRAGWTPVGTTKGFTCKRVGGKGTDSWTGKRVWDTKHRRPKRVFCKLNATDGEAAVPREGER